MTAGVGREMRRRSSRPNAAQRRLSVAQLRRRTVRLCRRSISPAGEPVSGHPGSQRSTAHDCQPDRHHRSRLRHALHAHARERSSAGAASYREAVNGGAAGVERAYLPICTANVEQTLRMAPCSWCGRPGEAREADAWQGNRLIYRDPVLCDVCVCLWMAPGEVHDVWYSLGVDYDTIEEAVSAAITDVQRRSPD